MPNVAFPTPAHPHPCEHQYMHKYHTQKKNLSNRTSKMAPLGNVLAIKSVIWTQSLGSCGIRRERTVWSQVVLDLHTLAGAYAGHFPNNIHYLYLKKKRSFYTTDFLSESVKWIIYYYFFKLICRFMLHSWFCCYFGGVWESFFFHSPMDCQLSASTKFQWLPSSLWHTNFFLIGLFSQSTHFLYLCFPLPPCHWVRLFTAFFCLLILHGHSDDSLIIIASF